MDHKYKAGDCFKYQRTDPDIIVKITRVTKPKGFFKKDNLYAVKIIHNNEEMNSMFREFEFKNYIKI